MGPSADENLTHGGICWQVDAGTGIFNGATGIITSNFYGEQRRRSRRQPVGRYLPEVVPETEWVAALSCDSPKRD